jgi:hypothetical protein
VESLRELPQLWDDAESSGCKLLAQALFDRIDVLGARKVRLHPSIGDGSRVGRCLEWGSIGCYGRGERADTPSSSLLIPVANIPSYVGRVWKTA